MLATQQGLLAGLVGVAGAGPHLSCWAAILAATLAGLAHCMLAGLLRLNNVDDPASAVSVHLGGGLVGSLAGGLAQLAASGSGMTMAWQAVAVVAVVSWAALASLIVLLLLLLCGKLRLRDCQERIGIDASKLKEKEVSDKLEPDLTTSKAPAPARTTCSTLHSTQTLQTSILPMNTSTHSAGAAPPPPPYPSLLAPPELPQSQRNPQSHLLPAAAFDVEELRAALKLQKERMCSLEESSSYSKAGLGLVSCAEVDQDQSRDLEKSDEINMTGTASKIFECSVNFVSDEEEEFL